MIDPSAIVAAGDWHGNSHWAGITIDYAAEHGADAIVQVGDFGLWRPGPDTSAFLWRVSKKAKERGVHVYWLDGNHEDHSRRHEFNDYDNDHLTYLPRGTRWEWWGKTFMAVGGAVSVDKLYRTEGKSWWPEEVLSAEDVKFAKRPGVVDVVFSHDCPTGVDIPGVGPDTKSGVRGDWPPQVLLEAGKHRLLMREIWEATQPELWIHGHYHIPYEYWLRETAFHGLGCDGDKLRNTVMLLTPDDI